MGKGEGGGEGGNGGDVRQVGQVTLKHIFAIGLEV